MGAEGHMPMPKYVIIADPVNPDLADLFAARAARTCVPFAVIVDGHAQEIELVPIEVYHTPSSNFCLIKGYVCSHGGPTTAQIEGMYHLASRAHGGFDDR